MSMKTRFNRAAMVVIAGLLTAAAPFHSFAATENATGRIRLDDIDQTEFEHFTVRLNGVIGLETATKLNRELKYLDAHNPHKKDITILINSPGGEVDQGLAILDTIRSLKSDVRTVCWGQCASMAAFLLTVGGTPGKRFVTPNAALMYHQPSIGCEGKATDVKICYNDVKNSKDKMVDELAAYSGLPRGQVKDAIARDWLVNPQDAVRYGLIDEIIPPVQKRPANIAKKSIPDAVMKNILRPE